MFTPKQLRKWIANKGTPYRKQRTIKEKSRPRRYPKQKTPTTSNQNTPPLHWRTAHHCSTAELPPSDQPLLQSTTFETHFQSTTVQNQRPTTTTPTK